MIYFDIAPAREFFVGKKVRLELDRGSPTIVGVCVDVIPFLNVNNDEEEKFSCIIIVQTEKGRVGFHAYLSNASIEKWVAYGISHDVNGPIFLD